MIVPGFNPSLRVSVELVAEGPHAASSWSVLRDDIVVLDSHSWDVNEIGIAGERGGERLFFPWSRVHRLREVPNEVGA